MPKRKTRSSTKAEKEDQTSHADDEEQIAPDDHTDVLPTEDQPLKQDIHNFTIHFKDDKQISCHRRSPNNDHDIPPGLIFTHGAGGGISAPSTADFATGFSSFAPILCYEGTMNLKNRIKYFQTVIEHEKAGTVLGGRSMGARAAVLTALERSADEDVAEKVKALVLVSYPLMAGTNGEKREPERREQILKDLSENVEVLFIVGDADAQCPLEMLEEVRGEMKAKSWLCVVEGADHGMSMKPKKASEGMRKKTGEVAAAWLKDRNEDARHSRVFWDAENEEIVHDGWYEMSSEEPREKKQKV